MEPIPGSASAGDKSDEDSLRSPVAKRRKKEALVHCSNLLQKKGIVAAESSSTPSAYAMAIGQQLYDSTVEMLKEKKLLDDEELIHCNEIDEEGLFHEVEDVTEDDDCEPDYEKMTKEAGYVPLKTKIKVVILAKEHPTWSLQTLQTKGSQSLKRIEDLKRWEEDIKSGGTTIDKYEMIDSWTYDRFVEARQNFKQVTTKNLQEWALCAATQFQSKDFVFKASSTWMKRFKQKHRIRERKIPKFVSKEEYVTLEETLDFAKTFRIQTRAIIPNFQTKFVINTSPMSCQYKSTYNRTLTEENSKTIYVDREDSGKTSKSYAAQYGITFSGQLLPQVFLSLQEGAGKFSPKVQKTVDQLTKDYRNVVVKSSKSGTITAQLHTTFLTSVLLPYVKKEKFLLMIEFVKGQTKPWVYDQTFTDDEHHCTCQFKAISSKCSSISQPSEVYFHRQVMNFINRLQNCSHLIENKREISSREDVIRIHSIVHHQLSAPIFAEMLRYAWFVIKLSDEREIYQNVNDVCFSTEHLKTPCVCRKAAFIRCSRCRVNLCFPCLYDKYHPATCDVASTSGD